MAGVVRLPKAIRFEAELWEAVEAEAARRSVGGRNVGASEVVRDLVRERLGDLRAGKG